MKIGELAEGAGVTAKIFWCYDSIRPDALTRPLSQCCRD